MWAFTAALLFAGGCAEPYSPPLRAQGSVLIRVVDEAGNPLTGAFCYPMATTNDRIFITGGWGPTWAADERGFAAPASTQKPLLCVFLQGYGNKYPKCDSLSTDGTNTAVLKRIQ